MEKIIHLGAEFHESKYGYKMSRETFLPALTDSVRRLFSSRRELQKYIDDCYKNFDLNINYCAKLDSDKFNDNLNKFLKKNQEFSQIFDITQAKNKSGYYIMVLDEYKQVYVGTSNSCIYKRLRKHMSTNIDFDRVLLGSWRNSILSINSFRPLDITRVYVYYTDDAFVQEDKYIKQFKSCFVLNRTIGGQLGGLFDALAHSRGRKLL